MPEGEICKTCSDRIDFMVLVDSGHEFFCSRCGFIGKEEVAKRMAAKGK